MMNLLPFTETFNWIAMESIVLPHTNFRSPTHRGSKQNLALIGQAVSEKKMFEHCEGRRRRTEARAWVYYKITYEPSTQES